MSCSVHTALIVSGAISAVEDDQLGRPLKCDLIQALAACVLQSGHSTERGRISLPSHVRMRECRGEHAFGLDQLCCWSAPRLRQGDAASTHGQPCRPQLIGPLLSHARKVSIVECADAQGARGVHHHGSHCARADCCVGERKLPLLPACDRGSAR